VRTGYVRVQIPHALERVAVWRVCVGMSRGRPNEVIATTPGQKVVSVHAISSTASLVVEGLVRTSVPVEENGVTDLRLPLNLQELLGSLPPASSHL
jgi:hypothetical protein